MNQPLRKPIVTPGRFIAVAIVGLVISMVYEGASGYLGTRRREATQAAITPSPTVPRPPNIKGLTAGGLMVDLKRLGFTCTARDDDTGHECRGEGVKVAVLRGEGSGARYVSCSVTTGRTYAWTVAAAACAPILDLVFQSDEVTRDVAAQHVVGWRGERVSFESEIASFTASRADDTYTWVFEPPSAP